MEELYLSLIRLGHTDKGEEAFARYVNGLKCSIQDELSLPKFTTIHESYYLAPKEKEKLSRKDSTS